MLSQNHPQQDDHPFAHLEHPYRWYKQIRQPPFYNRSYGAWIVSRYDDIRWVLERPALFSARDTLSPPQPPPESVLAVLAEGSPPVPAVLSSDGDQHRRLQRTGKTSPRSCRRGMNGLRLGCLPRRADGGILDLEYPFYIQQREHLDAYASPFR